MLKDSADVLHTPQILLPMHFSWASWCLLFLPFHSIEPDSIWLLWSGRTSTKDEAEVLKLNLIFPVFVYVCRDEKAGSCLNCLCDHVSLCSWICITEQNLISISLLCSLLAVPKVNLIQAKKHVKLSKQCFEMVAVLDKYISEHNLKGKKKNRKGIMRENRSIWIHSVCSERPT